MLLKPTHIETWCNQHKESFKPPIFNKLMHKQDLSIMFVGGPNTRTDFHIEMGPEFFFQLRGWMELPIIEQGKRKLQRIHNGQVFLLPKRIPHSPQRPIPGSLGLVIERKRQKGELDCLRWYKDFETCNEIDWQKYFECNDLGKDLVPIVREYQSRKTLSWTENVPFEQDITSIIPEPMNLHDIIKKAENGTNLFPKDHPEDEFSIQVFRDYSKTEILYQPETFLMQLEGQAIKIFIQEEEFILSQGECCVLAENAHYIIERSSGSIGLQVYWNKSMKIKSSKL